ncbi:MAG TPA: hypothetical protein VMZ50_06485, partial [Phycisphaerae bacterium]|nr:hypothetical protein [Phycisphaerae bacterium]
KTAEREFDADEHPYVQMYLKAADAKNPLFAKVCAARWEGEAAADSPDAATAAGAAKQILRSVQVGRPGAAP